jgi:hypothetical protein
VHPNVAHDVSMGPPDYEGVSPIDRIQCFVLLHTHGDYTIFFIQHNARNANVSALSTFCPLERDVCLKSLQFPHSLVLILNADVHDEKSASVRIRLRISTNTEEEIEFSVSGYDTTCIVARCCSINTGEIRRKNWTWLAPRWFA